MPHGTSESTPPEDAPQYEVLSYGEYVEQRPNGEPLDAPYPRDYGPGYLLVRRRSN